MVPFTHSLFPLFPVRSVRLLPLMAVALHRVPYLYGYPGEVADTCRCREIRCLVRVERLCEARFREWPRHGIHRRDGDLS